MNWDDVRIFLAVARAGQILGAARRLDLNHATVSRRVAALEDGARRKAVPPAHHRQRADAGRRALPRRRRAHGSRHDRRARRDRRRRRGGVRHGAHRRAGRFRRRLLAPRLGALTAAASAICRSSSCRCRAPSRCRGARPTSPSPSSARPKAGWSPQSSSTIRSASTPRAPMPKRTACRKRAAELPRHRLVGYVPDLVASPSLDYAAEFSPDWDAALLDLIGARPGRGGALGRRHRHPARLHRPRAARAGAGHGGRRRSAAPTGWSITRACGRCAASRRWPASSPRQSRRIVCCSCRPKS